MVDLDIGESESKSCWDRQESQLESRQGAHLEIGGTTQSKGSRVDLES